MSQTIDAVIEPNGTVRLLQPVHVTKPTRAVLTLTEDVPLPSEEVSSSVGGERPLPQTLEEAMQRMSDAKSPEELFAAYDEALKFEPPLPKGYDLLKALEENRKVPFCRPADWKAWGYDDE